LNRRQIQEIDFYLRDYGFELQVPDSAFRVPDSILNSHYSIIQHPASSIASVVSIHRERSEHCILLITDDKIRAVSGEGSFTFCIFRKKTTSMKTGGKPGRKSVVLSGRKPGRGVSKKTEKKPLVPYHRKPLELSMEAWQMALRRQFAEDHPFGIENTGTEEVFSDFCVTNPESGNTYKVSIRDNSHSFNFCSCYDFKTNSLGTCKHIEAVIYRIRKNKRTNRLYRQSYNPDYTSVYLNYLDTRKVKIRIGTLKENEYREAARPWFDELGELKAGKIGEFEKFLKQAARIDPSFRCYPDALDYILELRNAAFRHTIVEKHYKPFLNNGKFNGILNTKLFPYQREGICFAMNAGRCLIADDMGLGKTVQALGVAEVMKRAGDRQHPDCLSYLPEISMEERN